MNKSIAIAGLMAFGAVHTFGQQPAASSTTLDSKIWTVSTSVRGFYDSNYATAPSAYKDDSFGYSISPSFGINVPLDQTSLQLSYTYGYKYFEGRPNGKADQSHQISASMLHNFTENTRLSVSESFVVAQEPTIIDANGPQTLFLRTLGDNMRNTAKISLTHDFTEQVGVEVGYSNTFYNYDEDNSFTTAGGVTTQNISRSAILDRMQHLITADMRWYLAPDAIGIVGYQYGIVDFTADQFIGFNSAGAPMMSGSRDRDSHYAYVGFDKFFNNQLSLSPRAGFQYVDYDNYSQTELSPYADARLAYNYAEGSVASLGVRHQRITTDLDALDQEATTLYGNVTHRITSMLAASLFGQYQHSSLNGQLGNTFTAGGTDYRAWTSSEQLYSVGANLTYRLNQYFSTELGYSFDYLDSGVTNAAGDDARSFKRHQVYIGVRATY